MFFNLQQWLVCVCLLLVTTTALDDINAQATPNELNAFMTSDVIGLAYVDIDNMDLDASVDLLGKLGFKQTIRYQQMLDQLPESKKDIAKMKEAGLSRVYALLRTSDIQSMGTSFVMPLADGSDPKPAIELVKEMVAKLSGGTVPKYSIDSRDGGVIASGIAQFDRLKNVKSETVKDRSDIWKSIGNGTIGIVVFGDEDSRRVVRELMPAIPTPFDALNGELIADGTKWIGLSVKLDGSPELNIEIEATDETAAESYESLINGAMKMAKFLPQVRDVIPKSEIKFVFEALKPKRSGNRVSISASQLTKDLDRLAKVVGPQVMAVRKAAQKAQRMNTLRQHSLAILNYESAHRHFPAQYSVDDAGKPLLSWRVHVLPFLNQNDLYDEFKLDEPWDSDHNIKLVEKMPEIFADMNNSSMDSNNAGKTIFQVPAGEGLVFNTTTESEFGDLTDGASNTIVIVAMPIERAVTWTQPVDWNVDLKNPLEMLTSEGQTRAEVALCDGSVHSFTLKSIDSWKAMLTPQGGEIVSSDELE